jgi:hypothetical protein
MGTHPKDLPANLENVWVSVSGTHMEHIQIVSLQYTYNYRPLSPRWLMAGASAGAILPWQTDREEA